MISSREPNVGAIPGIAHITLALRAISLEYLRYSRKIRLRISELRSTFRGVRARSQRARANTRRVRARSRKVRATARRLGAAARGPYLTRRGRRAGFRVVRKSFREPYLTSQRVRAEVRGPRADSRRPYLTCRGRWERARGILPGNGFRERDAVSADKIVLTSPRRCRNLVNSTGRGD